MSAFRPLHSEQSKELASWCSINCKRMCSQVEPFSRSLNTTVHVLWLEILKNFWFNTLMEINRQRDFSCGRGMGNNNVIYSGLVICMHISEIEDITGMKFDELLLQQVHLGELNVVDSHTNQRLHMSEELLGVISVPVDDALRTSGMPWKVSRVVFRD